MTAIPYSRAVVNKTAAMRDSDPAEHAGTPMARLRDYIQHRQHSGTLMRLCHGTTLRMAP